MTLMAAMLRLYEGVAPLEPSRARGYTSKCSVEQ